MKVALPLLAIVAIAGCAPTNRATPGATAANQGRQCFPIHSVSSFAPVDDDTINVRVGVNDYYQMDLIGPCRDVDWALGVGLVPRSGGSFICSGMDVDVIAPSTLGPNRCPVTRLRKLTPTEVAALGRNQKP